MPVPLLSSLSASPTKNKPFGFDEMASGKNHRFVFWLNGHFTPDIYKRRNVKVKRQEVLVGKTFFSLTLLIEKHFPQKNVHPHLRFF